MTRKDGGNFQISRSSSGGYGTCFENEYCSRRFVILFVSVTGPQEITKSHSDLLKNLPVERDMKALRLFTDSMWKRTPWKEKTSGRLEVSLVHVMSKE